MKRSIFLLVSILMLANNQTSSGAVDGRKKDKKVVSELRGETFRIFRFIGTENQAWPYTAYGERSYLHMSFSDKCIKFVPDSSGKVLKDYIWYELGDEINIELKFKYSDVLTIYAASDVGDITIVKPLNGVYGGFKFPSSILAGDYYVKKGYITSGEKGYTLTSVAKNYYNNSRLIIELAIIEEF
ncbi:MAG: hypothetical protein KBB86_03325 [Candidatus Pacebacteria bacterium]|nr:hypothetical protein [Candidatus Paceibacterota bacterium]